MHRRIAVVDLFAGAGGLSVGAHLAGAKVSASLEIDPTACETLRANPRFHGKVIQGDVGAYTGAEIRKAAGIAAAEPLVIVGGPPCQPFSKAAYWTEAGDDAAYRRAKSQGIRAKKPPLPTLVKDDDRRDLVREFMRIVIESKADAFVFENVPSITHPRNRPVFERLLREARRAGFEVAEGLVNAAEYGVAQARQRVVALGCRGARPSIPCATHSLAPRRPRNIKAAVTAGDSIGEFNKKKYFEPEEVVLGRWARHLREVPPGWNYKAHTAWAGHPSPTFVTETRFWNFLLKLARDRPSWTLAATPGPWTGPFHWDSRRLRTIEMAALQGFPATYVVKGNRRERVRQMGNAVPVPLAIALIRSVLETLEANS